MFQSEVAEMKISSSNTEVMVLSQKRVGWSLQLRGESMFLAEECLGILFTSDGIRECENEEWISYTATIPVCEGEAGAQFADKAFC